MNEDRQVYEAEPVTQETALATVDTDTAMVAMERRLELMRRVLPLAIKTTGSQHWSVQGDKPFLSAGGAERVAMAIGGITLTPGGPAEKEIRTDESGPYYVYTMRGTATWRMNGEIITQLPIIGSCSSRDKFFGRAGGDFKPMEEVDEENIRKKCRTNFEGNGIKRLLGLNEISLKELADAGVDVAQITHVEFKTGSKGGTTSKKCPKCGRPMARRQSSRGAFWGCTGYSIKGDDQCKHTEHITDDEAGDAPQSPNDEQSGDGGAPASGSKTKGQLMAAIAQEKERLAWSLDDLGSFFRDTVGKARTACSVTELSKALAGLKAIDDNDAESSLRQRQAHIQALCDSPDDKIADNGRAAVGTVLQDGKDLTEATEAEVKAIELRLA